MTNKPQFVGERVSFTAAFSEVSRGVKKFKRNQYVEYGAHPIVDQGQESIAGYSDDETGLFNDVPAIVFGDHTRCVKYVEEPFFAGADGVKILKPRLSDNTRFWWHELKATPIENLGYSRHFKLLKAATFKNYDTASQTEIVARLDSILDQIAQVNQQIEQLDQLIKSRFVEMFGDLEHGYKCPSCELCSVAEVGSSKRVFKSELLSEGVPFYRGTEIADLSAGKPARPNLFISKEHYEKLIAATGRPEAGDLLLPSICPDGQIWCVNTDAPFYFKDGRVLWIRPNRDAIDGVYLRHALSTMFQMSFSSIASGTTFAELKIFLLKGLNIPLPNLKTQKEFAAFVQQVDKLKFIAQRQIEKLQELYDSLAQEYFGV